jgi:hypothetical protein
MLAEGKGGSGGPSRSSLLLPWSPTSGMGAAYPGAFHFPACRENRKERTRLTKALNQADDPAKQHQSPQEAAALDIEKKRPKRGDEKTEQESNGSCLLHAWREAAPMRLRIRRLKRKPMAAPKIGRGAGTCSVVVRDPKRNNEPVSSPLALAIPAVCTKIG